MISGRQLGTPPVPALQEIGNAVLDLHDVVDQVMNVSYQSYCANAESRLPMCAFIFLFWLLIRNKVILRIFVPHA
jgi:hypothetical protein